MHMPLRLCPVFSVVVCLVFDSVLLLLDVKWAKPVRLWAATVCNGPHFVTHNLHELVHRFNVPNAITPPTYPIIKC